MIDSAAGRKLSSYLGLYDALKTELKRPECNSSRACCDVLRSRRHA